MNKRTHQKPHKLHLAHLPTPVFFIEERRGVFLFMKADDQTGFGLSGNKVRKLEYLFKEAQDGGATDVITCGGLQSNHARATALAARRLGLTPHLLLRGEEVRPEGNGLINCLVGAQIRTCSDKDYKEKRQSMMGELKAAIDAQGGKAYVIDEGGSVGVGLYGYVEAFEEILSEEQVRGESFDVIAAPFGSGGTHAGLVLGQQWHNTHHRLLAINVYDAGLNGVQKICDLAATIDPSVSATTVPLTVFDEVVGEGYGVPNPGDGEWIRRFAKEQGILLDPVYTGKALAGLYARIDRGDFPVGTRLLFIHTGGFFGSFAVDPGVFFK